MTGLPQADWADTLAELARFAADRDLPAPLSATFPGDDARHVTVAVSGPAHLAWFEHFDQCHDKTPAEHLCYHRSHGYLRSGVRVELTCFADAMLPSQVSA